MRSQDPSHELMLAELMDCVDELVFVLDSKLRIARANRTAAVSLGYAEADLVSMKAARLVVPGDRKRVEALLRGADERSGGETIILTRAGERMKVRFVASPLSDCEYGINTRLLVFRRLRNEPADATNGLAARMLKGFAAPLFVIDGPSRTVRDCNQAALGVSGFSRDELIGRRLLGHAKGAEEKQRCRAVEDRAFKTYATAGIYQERILYPRNDAPALPCDLTGIPFFNADSSLDAIIVMLADRSIEEERAAEFSGLVSQVRDLASRFESLASTIMVREKPQRLSEIGFTPRQIEIARLCAQGAPSKEIGYRLGIAESTVKNHLGVMYRKLGASSRMTFIRVLATNRIKIE
jgi:PAS domain S-box-containing protein